MEISSDGLLGAIDERSRIYEMALPHAVSIFNDLQSLSLSYQKMMTDIIKHLISSVGDEA